jgi:hypothetical protein
MGVFHTGFTLDLLSTTALVHIYADTFIIDV